MKTHAQHPSYYRHVPYGVISAGIGTTVGNAIGGKSYGIAGGALASIASSLLVRSRTDKVTSLVTCTAGLVTTAGLTISLNKRKKKRNSVNCYTF